MAPVLPPSPVARLAWPLPNPGDVFADVRDADRTMRVSQHRDSGVVVVSLWAGRTCRASFQLAVGDLPRLLAAIGQPEASTSPVLPEASTSPAPPEASTSPALPGAPQDPGGQAESSAA
jgi:hypothetical protein